MKPYQKYLISTSLYGLCAIIGCVGIIFFALRHELLFTILSIIFAYVAFDNFFCGSRACHYGVAKTEKQYIIPPFLKRR